LQTFNFTEIKSKIQHNNRKFKQNGELRSNRNMINATCFAVQFVRNTRRIVRRCRITAVGLKHIAIIGPWVPCCQSDVKLDQPEQGNNKEYSMSNILYKQ